MKARVLVLSVFASACGAGGLTDHPDASAPVFGMMTLGGGTEDGEPGFVDLQEGQDVPLVPGAQGGFHVYLNVRIEEASMPADRSLYIDRRARREDNDKLVSQNRQRITFVEGPEGYFDSEASMLMFLCPAPIGIKVNDQPLVVRVNARVDHTSEEILAEGTVRLTPRCPSGQQAEFCARICSGD